MTSITTWHHLLSKGSQWIHQHWKTFETECTLETSTTTSTTMASETTSKKVAPSAASSIGLGGYEYFKAAIVLIAMQFFTLSVWYQIRI